MSQVAKRLRHEPLPPFRFDLGRFGIWINCIALCWLALLKVFSFLRRRNARRRKCAANRRSLPCQRVDSGRQFDGWVIADVCRRRHLRVGVLLDPREEAVHRAGGACSEGCVVQLQQLSLWEEGQQQRKQPLQIGSMEGRPWLLRGFKGNSLKK